MPAGAAAYRDQAIDAGLQRLFRVAHFDDIVKHGAAVFMHARHQCGGCRERRDDDGHFVLEDDFEIGVEPLVGFVHDQVDRVRSDFLVGMLALVLRELGLDTREPLVELFLWTRVQRGERADHAGLALLDHQLGAGHNEHGSAEHGDAQTAADLRG